MKYYISLRKNTSVNENKSLLYIKKKRRPTRALVYSFLVCISGSVNSTAKVRRLIKRYK